jgi:threonine dehydratase
MLSDTSTLPYTLDIESAYEILKPVVYRTPLNFHKKLSEKYQCHVYLKREDLQVVRSYKLRGAYNLISSLSSEQLKNGVVCASAGNHAQGFAYSCQRLGIQGVVFMPSITPKQKVKQVAMFGGEFIEIVLIGDTFDECAVNALDYTQKHGKTFIPPFDHPKIIEGQGTVGLEILQELPNTDFIFIPVGGGGLSAGVGYFFKQKSPATRIIGMEPAGAPSMKIALETGEPVMLEKIDRFVDGAAVKKVGAITFQFCKSVLDDMLLVPEGKVCTTILQLYNEDAIVVEPAGALSIASLDQYADKIKGKTVVCIVSGGNNDIDRMQEIKERSLLYEGLKKYFIINFAQRPGALKQFVNNVLGPDDDIIRFEYVQKHNKETGPALVGIELKSKSDFERLLINLNLFQMEYRLLNDEESLFEFMI